MEDEVVSVLNASAFNVYDLLVRLAPGVFVLTPAALLFVPPCFFLTLDDHSVLVLLCFIAISYAVGVLLRLLARMRMKCAHSKLYGGEPRDRFLELSAKKTKEVLGDKAENEFTDEDKRRIGESAKSLDDDGAVLKYADERRLAITCAEEIRKILRDSKAKPRLCFGYMVNYLEVHGSAGKEDRVSCLADMCASLALALPIAGIECIVRLLGHPSWGVLLMVVALFVVTLILSQGYVRLATRYEQMRFSIVVRTYAILRERARAADAGHPRTHQIQGSIKLTKNH